MARIEFHFNAPGLTHYVCRLLRKIHASGRKAQVTGSHHMLVQIDQALWTFSELDFLPHCHAQAPVSMLNASGILLVETPLVSWSRDILVNVGESIPVDFQSFDKVIDVVSVDELDRAQGRERWRAYGRLGHELVRHDLSQLGLR